MELTPSNSLTINKLLENLDSVKRNPSNIQKVIFNYLDEVTEGRVNLVDPTNPFVFLLESSAVNTALAVNESIINLRKQYASLARTEDEVYMHLSDNDFLNRFSSPSVVDFTMVIQVNDLIGRMVEIPTERASKVTIPRDTQFTIDDYVFTLTHPIDIRKYENGVVQISYDGTIKSPVNDLSTSIIDYVVRKDENSVDWIFFKIKLKQFEVSSVNFPLQKSIAFNEDISFNDDFYTARCFHKGNASNSVWEEIKTTHTDQVYDPFKATALLKVTSGTLNVTIPPVYLNTRLITGELRVDIYTTKGKLTVNLANYKVGSFTVSLRAIDEQRDLDQYTSAMSTVSFYAYSDEFISGGEDGIDFNTLRDRVIFNTTGTVNIPINNKQLETLVDTKGFDLVKNVDSVTNRLFLATQKLPKPLNTKLTTSANVGISTFISTKSYLKSLSRVKNNGDRITLVSKNLFESINGVIKILTSSEIQTILNNTKANLMTIANTRQFMYNPFYYVLDDSNNEFELRAYNLDYPKASGLSFVAQNHTLQLPVNTGSYNLAKTIKGYRLTVTTKSGNFYKQLPDASKGLQLAFYPLGETRLAYINGTLESVNEDDESIYSFEIETNHDIDNKNRVCITNAEMLGTGKLKTWIELDSTFHMFHYTDSFTSEYKRSNMDDLFGDFMLPVPVGVVTYETMSLELGTVLKNLWTRSRTIAVASEYRRHTVNTPLFYEDDVYEKDPVTGAIFSVVNDELVYTKLHNANDPVLDLAGNAIYKHKVGDLYLDPEGRPMSVDSDLTEKEVDLLFVDGRHYFTDDPAYVSYNDEIASVLDTWITEDINSISEVLLEQTKIYFYPKTTLGKVKIYTVNEDIKYISSEQSLSLDLYVKKDVYNDVNVRSKLEEETIALLDTHISGTVVNMSDISNELIKMYGVSVESMNISGLGGSENYRIVTLASEQNRLCLKKSLRLQQDNSLIIKEDVVINFYQVK